MLKKMLELQNKVLIMNDAIIADNTVNTIYKAMLQDINSFIDHQIIETTENGQSLKI